MKRYAVLFVVILMIIGIFIVGKNEKTVNAIEVTAQHAPIYDEATKRVISTVQQGFSFVTEKPCDTLCYGMISNRSVTIAAEHVVVQQVEQQDVTAATTGETMTTLYDAVIYKEMSDTSEQIATVHAYVTMPVLQKEGDWLKVELLGQTGYMQTQQLEEQLEVVSFVYVKHNTPLYTDATEQTVVATITAGAHVVVSKVEQAHYIVRIGETETFMQKEAGVLHEEERALALKQDATAHIIVSKPTAVAIDKQIATLLPAFRYPIVAITSSHYVLTIGGQLAYVKKSDAALDKGIPAVVYHHILQEHELGDYVHASSTVTTTAFEQHMHYLHAAGFQTLNAVEAAKYMAGHITAREAVIITFDDGLLSTKEYAYNVLKRYHMTALQHIISARKDRTTEVQSFDPNVPLQFLNDAEMAQMTDVFSYEAHTFNLHILDEERKMSRLMLASAGELRDDIRQNLEDVPTATTFAYPFGQYKRETIDVLTELGIQLAFTTTPGYSTASDHPYTMKRFTPTQHTTLEQFERYVTGVGW